MNRREALLVVSGFIFLIFNWLWDLANNALHRGNYSGNGLWFAEASFVMHFAWYGLIGIALWWLVLALIAAGKKGDD